MYRSAALLLAILAGCNKPSLPAWPATVTRAHVSIQPLAATVGQVQARVPGESEPAQSRHSYLALRLRITNQSATNRVRFHPWRSTLLGEDHCVAIDEHGNDYQLRMLWGDPVGDDGGKTLNPGDSLTTVVLFEPPIDVTNQLRIILEGEPLGLPEERWEWSLARPDWELATVP